MTAPLGFPNSITWWPVTRDVTGGPSFGSPTTLNANWQDRQIVYRNAKGDDAVSRATVFLTQDVDVGDYLYNGISTASDPSVLAGAYPVRQFSKIPDLRSLKYEHKAIL